MDDHALRDTVIEHGATLNAILSSLQEIKAEIHAIRDRGRMSIVSVGAVIAATGLIVTLIVEPRITSKVAPLEAEIASIRRELGVAQRQIETYRGRSPFNG
jgi:DNA-binding transcriptional regulator YiaG